MTTTAANRAAPIGLTTFKGRLLTGAMGMLAGLLMGLLVWILDVFTGGDHHILLITVGLMLVEGALGFFIPDWLASKFDSVVAFIVAMFIVP